MRLGSYTLRSHFLLAPIAGVTDLHFRRLALGLGAGLAPTELVSAEGLARGSARTLRYLERDPALERPFCVQLFGAEPERMVLGALAARDAGAEIIDINMGCPVPKVTRSGAGSALMLAPERAAKLVEAVATATGLPVTAKLRSGWEAGKINAPELSQLLEEAGAAAVAIHARTKSQGYGGTADWSVIARVKERVRIPVIGNGDVRSPADARRMFETTGCDAVMVGRAAIGNPWIFRELLGGPAPSREERHATVRAHLEAHVGHYESELAGLRSFRQTLAAYAAGLHGASLFRETIMTAEGLTEVLNAVDTFFLPNRSDSACALGKLCP